MDESRVISTDGGSVKVKADNQGRVPIKSQNGNVSIPLADIYEDIDDYDFSMDGSFDMDDLMDLIPVRGPNNGTGTGVGQYNTTTHSWSW